MQYDFPDINTKVLLVPGLDFFLVRRHVCTYVGHVSASQAFDILGWESYQNLIMCMVGGV